MDLRKIYSIEPELEIIAVTSMWAHRCDFDEGITRAYLEAKEKAESLVGFRARDLRLRSAEAYDCYFDYVLGNSDEGKQKWKELYRARM
jgi:hypothetical protein